METFITQKVSVVLRPLMSDQLIQQRILQSAHELMVTYGIRSVTMDDMASQLGISKKTIYKYFSDKDTIVEEVVNAVLKQNAANCVEDKLKSENAVHEMVLAMARVVEMLQAMNPSVLFDLRKYHPKAFQSFYRHKQEYLFGVMKQNLIRGKQEELYRSDIQVDIIARFRVESILMPFDPGFSKDHKFSLVEMEQEILANYLFGLVTLKGYKLAIKYMQKKTIKNNKK